jgi:glycosyltransferase involved in cell wall biosynthesis
VSEFSCTVVIASDSRPDQLNRLLSGLSLQTTDARIEVIVILDGVTDASRNVALAWEEKVGAFASFLVYEQSRNGLAAARNRGAFLARGPVLLFLDDDVIPEADLISVHLRHHATADHIAVLGDLEPVQMRPHSLCELSLWSWWEDTFHRRSAPGQPSSFRDFTAGNVSLRAEDFSRAGGFDTDFATYRREGHELGHRLLNSGVRFVAERGARARRHTVATVRGALRAKRNEAQGDVLLARKYPELIRGLPLMAAGDKRARRAAGLAMFLPWIGDLIFLARATLLWIPERLRRRRSWQAKFDVLQTYAYWRGLRRAVGSMKAVHALRETALPPMTQQIDASRPLAAQVERLNIDVPSRLLVLYKDDAVGSIELNPGNPEPLLPWIVREISERMASTLLLDVARGVLVQQAAEAASDVQLIETA